ncbi:MAG: hypothetical protein HFI66_03340 [Lachnospiraceae bacterium]|nr:hypothetical protein [Lachnospiraceae bacterium]
MAALERYRTIHEIFDQRSLLFPEIFYTLFFSKRSKRLPTVIKQYYELFPGELEGHYPAVREINAAV